MENNLSAELVIFTMHTTNQLGQVYHDEFSDTGLFRFIITINSIKIGLRLNRSVIYTDKCLFYPCLESGVIFCCVFDILW